MALSGSVHSARTHLERFPLSSIEEKNADFISVPLKRHLLPTLLTTIVLSLGWAVLTGPLAAVFLLDGSFSIDGYVLAFLQVAAVSALACLLFFAPLSELLRSLGRRQLVLSRLLPPLALALSVFVLIFALMHSADRMVTVFGWPGRVVLGTAFFLFYWVVSGLEAVLRVQWKRLRRCLASPPKQSVL